MLTAKQHQTLKLIKKYIADNGYPPTNKEIASLLNIKSRGVVHRYLKILEAKGCLSLLPNQKRNIKIISDVANLEENTIPIMGSIAAGKPIEAVATQDALDISSLFLGPGRYALRVKGDSMVGDGIFDGDIVVCQQAKVAKTNQIVVALIDQEFATLKKIAYEPPSTVLLKPANSAHLVQRYDASRVDIQGVLIGLLRVNY